MVLAPLRQLESVATHDEDSALRNFNSLNPVANKASSSSSSFSIRSALEDMELATRSLTEPLPTNQQVNWVLPEKNIKAHASLKPSATKHPLFNLAGL